MTTKNNNQTVKPLPHPLAPPEKCRLKNKTEIDTIGDKWAYTFDKYPYYVDFTRVQDYCTPEHISGAKWTWHTRMGQLAPRSINVQFSVYVTLVRYLYETKNEPVDIVTLADVVNFKGSHQSFEFRQIRGTLRTFIECGFYGVDAEVESILDVKDRQGRNAVGLKYVTTLDSEKGPLIGIEEDLVSDALKDRFEKEVISLKRFCLVKLNLLFGSRPEQLTRLQLRHLEVNIAATGSFRYAIFIPFAKQRNEKQPQRFPLTKSLGDALHTLAETIRMKFPAEDLPDDMTWDDLPFFPEEDIPVPRRAENLGADITRVGKLLNVTSPRKGSNDRIISFSPLINRYTVGTRLATKERYDEVQISRFLQQTDPRSCLPYVHVGRDLLAGFDNYWSPTMKQWAKLAGEIIDDDDEAPGPTVTFSSTGKKRKGIGKCGKANCQKKAPIACYPCTEFRPKLHGAHSEFLQELENDRLNVLEKEPHNIGVYDNAIYYVKLTIAACEHMKKERGE